MNKNHFLCVKRKKKERRQQTASYEEISDLFSKHQHVAATQNRRVKKKNQHTEKNLHSIFTTSHLAFYERWPFRYGIHFASLFHCLTLDKQLNRFLVLILLDFFSVTHPLYNISIFFLFFLYATLWQIVNMHVMYSPLRFYYEEREGNCVFFYIIIPSRFDPPSAAREMGKDLWADGGKKIKVAPSGLFCMNFRFFLI